MYVKRQVPAIKSWNLDSMRSREKFELKNGGFGLGKITTESGLHEDLATDSNVHDIHESSYANAPTSTTEVSNTYSTLYYVT